MSSNEKDHPLSIAEQELELAQRKAEEAARKRQEAAQQAAIKAAAEERTFNQFVENVLHEAAAAGLEKHPDLAQDDYEAILSSALKYEVSPDGTFVIRNGANKQIVDTEIALKNWASDSRHQRYFNAATIQRIQTPASQLCKRDMTTAQKVRYLQTHSLEQYEQLPWAPPAAEVPVELLTPEIWDTLSATRKSQLIGQYGEEWLSDMLKMRRKR